MNKLIKLFSLSILSIVTSNAMAAPAPTDANAAMVKATMTAFMEKNHIPGAAVELYVDGKPYEYYFGYANREKKTPVNKHTIFEVGSISKVMTSLVLAQEVDFAKVNLNDPVNKYLHNLSDDYSDITLKNLATHTSGILLNLPADIKTQSGAYQYFADWTPGDAAGDQWIYSNAGVGVLGYALEKFLHKNIDQIYRTRILNPLKMQAIGTVVPKKMSKFYAQGYQENGDVAPHYVVGAFPAAGLVKASATDMQRFLSAAVGVPGIPDRVLYPMRLTQSAFVKLPHMDQGLGWEIHALAPEKIADLLDVETEMNLGPIKVEEIYQKPIYNGNSLIDKTGGTAGFRTYMAVIPNKKSGIVILTNKFVAHGEIVKAGREILFKLTDIKPEETAEESDIVEQK